MTSDRIELVGLDADDTLWHNEHFYRLTQARFIELLDGHAEGDHVAERLTKAEKRNLKMYGYGIKGFTLSMIETALEITNNHVPATVIKEILAAGQDLLVHPVETLPGVDETVGQLAETYRLVLITKGDLFDQERKLAASGLGDMFSAIEIVSEKKPDVYGRIFDELGPSRAHCAMVGNSVKSDILPAIAAGGFAVHVPHEHEWELEKAELPRDAHRFRQAEVFADILEILAGLDPAD